MNESLVLLFQPLSFVGVMKPVQPGHPSKVDVKTLMMTVMTISCTSKEIEATMNSRSLNKLPSDKSPHGQYVSSKQYGWKDNRDRVGYNMLDRMGILRGEGDWCCELVVDFVDATIEVWYVKKSMGIVKEDLSSN